LGIMPKSLLKKIPGAGAWLSALALYAFCRGFLVVMALVLPPLFERLRGNPRLEALATLGVWLSPILLIALAHAAVTAALDRFDTHVADDASRAAARASGWAGLYSWLVALFASVTTLLVGMVINPPRRPPPPPDPDALVQLGQLLDVVSPLGDGGLTVHTVLWIAIAALLYKIEARTRRGGRREA
jgi:hypothetical protein